MNSQSGYSSQGELHRQADEALSESERKSRDLADLLPEIIFETDIHGTVTYGNARVLTSLNLTADDLKKGINIFEFIAPEYIDFARKRFAKLLQREDIGSTEYVLRRKDGTTFPVLVHSLAIVRNDRVQGIRGVAIDLTERKRSERALIESETRFRTALDSMLEACVILDFNYRYVYANDSAVRMGRRTREERLGHTLMEVYPGIEKQDAYTHVRRSMEERVPDRYETEFTFPEGIKVWLEMRITPVPEGLLILYLDVTQDKFAERRLNHMVAELDRSNKELEQFAYIASHDLREPLRMITGFCQSLEKRYKDKLDKTANEYITFIVDGAARMQNLIDDLLSYSRVGTRGAPFEPVDMEGVVQEVLVNLKMTIQETGAKVTHDPLPVIQADPAQMMQVLQNLVGNAIKFRREEAVPTAHISVRRDGEEWIFSIKDNGIGIDPELFRRLFILFSRLHPPDKYPGTGLGLAVAKRIVQRHGGRIWVESQPGKGSTFYFSIPVTTKREKRGEQ